MLFLVSGLHSFLIIFLFLLGSFSLPIRLVLFTTKISNVLQLPPSRASSPKPELNKIFSTNVLLITKIILPLPLQIIIYE